MIPIAKRAKAARGAAEMSLDEFAEAIGVGRSTQIRTEGGRRTPKTEELRAMAAVSGLPIEFFTVDDLAGTLSGEGDESISRRVEALERSFETIESLVAELRSAVARHQGEKRS